MPLTLPNFILVLRSYVAYPGYLDLGMRNVEFSLFITTTTASGITTVATTSSS